MAALTFLGQDDPTEASFCDSDQGVAMELPPARDGLSLVTGIEASTGRAALCSGAKRPN